MIGTVCLSFVILLNVYVADRAEAQEQPDDSGHIVDYYLPLAKAGNTEAQYLLALGYERGLAEAVDRRAAAKWYREAAQSGHTRAAYRLGLLLLRGDSVPEDRAEAVRFFKQAAEAKHPEALYYLGYIAERGLNGSSDNDAALDYFERAADLGLVAAMKAAASLHVRRPDQPQNLPKAWYWLNLAAKSHDKEALDMKGKLEGMMTASQIESAKALSR